MGVPQFDVRMLFRSPFGSRSASLDWRIARRTGRSHSTLRRASCSRRWRGCGPVSSFGDSRVRSSRTAGGAPPLRRTSGQQQLDLLRAATEALGAAGVEAVVLKGLPLGDRLYGDPFVRCSADIDLHVPASQRARASAVLGALGWRINDGQAPWHQTWSTWRSDVAYYLELHSSLVSDHPMHLAAPRPAPSRRASPASRCAHMREISLRRTWRCTSRRTRCRLCCGWWTSRRSGPLYRRSTAFGRRPLRGARACPDTWSGRGNAAIWCTGWRWAIREALGTLGVAPDHRHDVHSIWRHLSLAASTADRARVLAAFLIPRRVRGDLRALAQYTLARLRTRLLSLAGATRAYLPHDTPAANGDAPGTSAAARPLGWSATI